LSISGLTEETDYTLYFFVEDLTGNYNDKVVTFNFTTLKKQRPASFQIKLQGDVNTTKLIQAFGLATGITYLMKSKVYLLRDSLSSLIHQSIRSKGPVNQMSSISSTSKAPLILFKSYPIHSQKDCPLPSTYRNWIRILA
jgi:hypothetical protein